MFAPAHQVSTRRALTPRLPPGCKADDRGCALSLVPSAAWESALYADFLGRCNVRRVSHWTAVEPRLSIDRGLDRTVPGLVWRPAHKVTGVILLVRMLLRIPFTWLDS